MNKALLIHNYYETPRKDTDIAVSVFPRPTDRTNEPTDRIHTKEDERMTNHHGRNGRNSIAKVKIKKLKNCEYFSCDCFNKILNLWF